MKPPRPSTLTATTKPRKSRADKATVDPAADRERTYVEPPSTSTRTSKQKKASDADFESSAALRKTPTHATRRRSTSHRELSPPHVPQSQLIRRVNAIIEVPIKEEEYSDYEGLGSSSSGSEYIAEKQKSIGGHSSKQPSSRGKRRNRDEYDDDQSEDDDQLLLGSEVSTDAKLLSFCV